MQLSPYGHCGTIVVWFRIASRPGFQAGYRQIQMILVGLGRYFTALYKAPNLTLKPASGHQNIAPAGRTFDADIQSNTQDSPCLAPARVRLAELYDVAYSKIQRPSHSCFYLCCLKSILSSRVALTSPPERQRQQR
jgi:hypothetical protein